MGVMNRMISLKKYVIDHFSNKSKQLEEISKKSKYLEENCWILSQLTIHLGKSKRYNLLELGCGEGSLLKFLAPALTKISLCGIDITKSLIVSAKKKVRANLLVSDAEKLPFKDGSFSVIVCRNLLHHLVGNSIVASRRIVWRVLLEMKRILRGGGYFIIVEQCVDSKALSHLIFMSVYIPAKLNVSVSHFRIQNGIITSFLTPREILEGLQKLHMQIMDKRDIRSSGWRKPFNRMFIVATTYENQPFKN